MIYTPSYFKSKSCDQVKNFIRSNSFGTLVSILETGDLQISKTPFDLIEAGNDLILEGHLAFNNPHLETLKENTNVSVLFDGAHGYISPMHYKNPERSVPTWNYSTALIKGKAEVIEDTEWLIGFVSRLSNKYEKNDVWFSQVDKNYLNNLGKGATGIRIKIESIEAKFKLNQQTSKEERDSLIEEISKNNPELARDMKNTEKWDD